MKWPWTKTEDHDDVDLFLSRKDPLDERLEDRFDVVNLVLKNNRDAAALDAERLASEINTLRLAIGNLTRLLDERTRAHIKLRSPRAWISKKGIDPTKKRTKNK